MICAPRTNTREWVYAVSNQAVIPSVRTSPTPTQLDAATEHAARAFLEKLAGRYAVTAGIVFGSRARRNHRPASDAEVAVLLRGRPERFTPTMPAMADIAYDVLLDTGIHLQPLPI